MATPSANGDGRPSAIRILNTVGSRRRRLESFGTLSFARGEGGGGIPVPGGVEWIGKSIDGGGGGRHFRAREVLNQI